MLNQVNNFISLNIKIDLSYNKLAFLFLIVIIIIDGGIMYIKVNNVNIHYEVYGKGQPFILLHGNSENYQIFTNLINKLKNNYQVYALDSRCHGQSEDVKSLSYDLMADDVIDFTNKLKIKNPILYGFSDGGITGLCIAIKKPKLLSKLIVSGVNINPSGFKAWMLFITWIGYFFTRNKKYRLMLKEPNIKKSELNKIEVPTILLAGEHDMVKYGHTLLIHKNIKNSILEIIPKENHSSYVIKSDKLYDIIKWYL